jgi:hypothetical protein
MVRPAPESSRTISRLRPSRPRARGTDARLAAAMQDDPCLCASVLVLVRSGRELGRSLKRPDLVQCATLASGLTGARIARHASIYGARAMTFIWSKSCYLRQSYSRKLGEVLTLRMNAKRLAATLIGDWHAMGGGDREGGSRERYAVTRGANSQHYPCASGPLHLVAVPHTRSRPSPTGAAAQRRGGSSSDIAAAAPP